MSKQLRIIILILVGSCILNLIFALNAGQKRRIAISKTDTLDARLAEIELRYKNAIQSYDDVDKELRESKKDLEEQKRFSDTLKEALASEQKKSLTLQQDLEVFKVKSQKKTTPVSNITSKR